MPDHFQKYVRPIKVVLAFATGLLIAIGGVLAWSPADASSDGAAPVPALVDSDTMMPIIDSKGEPVVDEAGRLALLDTSKTGPLHDRMRELYPSGLNEKGEAVSVVYHEHVDELRALGAIEYVVPTPELLARFCETDAVRSGDCSLRKE